VVAAGGGPIGIIEQHQVLIMTQNQAVTNFNTHQSGMAKTAFFIIKKTQK
jgi:hypothetical protein